MAASLSAYWVKFFQGAGFPLDVATRHAVVFSNNRIKPDMLPDLDKASLKDMGITLIGDMIAILRYAKKVVETMTCENFLVDTEDDKPRKKTKPSLTSRDAVKVAVVKAPVKAIVAAKSKNVQENSSKVPTKSLITGNGTVRATLTKKKLVTVSRPVAQVVKETTKSQSAVKRKSVRVEAESESDEMPELDADPEERAIKTSGKRLKPAAEEEKVGYTVIMPKGRTIRSQQILMKMSDQKRTVFDRLGDSSVTSTTNLAETTTTTGTAASPTFNITGLGSDTLKRSYSVFNRLGDKEALEKVKRTCTTSPVKDASETTRPGILKTARPSTVGTTALSIRQEPSTLAAKSVGTMRADHEKNAKNTSNRVRQIVRTAKKIRLGDQSKIAWSGDKTTTNVNTTSKLASERVEIVPAKARLGLGVLPTKQVTFDRFAKVTSFEKPGVFSRLGF